MDDHVEALYAEVKKLIAQGNLESARNKCEQALSLVQEMQDSDLESAVLIELGNIQTAHGSFAQALEWFQKALTVAQKMNNAYREVDALNGLNRVCFLGNVYDKQAIPRGQKALQLAQTIGYTEGHLKALNILGGLQLHLKKYPLAFGYYQKALQFARQTNNRPAEIETLNGLGNVYCEQKRYQQALEHYQQAIDLADEIGTRSMHGVILNNLGQMQFVGMRKYKEAFVNFQQALEVARELKHTYGEVQALTILGVVSFRMREYDEAESYLQEALPIASKAHMHSSEGIIYSWLGAVAYRRKYHLQAIEYYEQSLACFAQSNQGANVRKIRNAILDIQIRYFLTFRWLFK